MKTRTADSNVSLSQERYMSSREFNELRGVSAIAASARAAIIPNLEKRKLVWWLQALSLTDGGLRRVADELLVMFPDRLGTKTMHASGARPGKIFSGKPLHAIRYELGDSYDFQETEKTESVEQLIVQCRQLAREGLRPRDLYSGQTRVLSLEECLIDLCINPRIQIRTVTESAGPDEIETDFAREKFRDLEKSEFKNASVPYFKDIIGALIQYKARRDHEAKEKFVTTAISQKIWDTLDFALTTRSMVLLDGLEGRGKTEAVKAWCELHLADARFISLKGVNNKTAFFREIARALGVPANYSYQSAELQCRIEDVLQRSKLMLVVDEAHFAFAQGTRIRNRPELLDWIDTSICNRRIPIALVTTPQFLVCMTRAHAQVDWNYRQFRRRVRRYVKLPAKNTPHDIEQVIRAALPGATNSAVKQVLAYVHLTRRDLSAVGDVVDEIKAMQGRDVLAKVTYEEIVRVIDEHLVPSEKNFVEAITEAQERVAPRRSKRTRSETSATEAPADGEDLAGDKEIEEQPENETDRNRIATPRSVGAPRFEENLITV